MYNNHQSIKFNNQELLILVNKTMFNNLLIMYNYLKIMYNNHKINLEAIVQANIQHFDHEK